jgi:alpha-1,3-rhamnosyltransferase
MEDITNKETLEQPLVSIIVITYNSSKYVLETLESAKAQTYQNIELIVSDDCSTDNTVEICQEWMAKNKERFVRSELITSEKNTGIPANCNRGVKAAKGEWVKFIAGDDILIGNCISNNIKFIFKNRNVKVVYSNMLIRKMNNEKRIIYPPKELISSTHSIQYKELLKCNWINAPTVFLNKKTLIQVNGFNEKYSMIEDYPMWIKLFKLNIKWGYLNQVTAIYREQPDSLTNNSFGRNRKRYLISYLKVYRDIIYPELLKKHLFISYINFKIEHYVLKSKLIKNKNLKYLLYFKPSNISKYARNFKKKKSSNSLYLYW